MKFGGGFGDCWGIKKIINIMQKSYIPKASGQDFCKWINLCTVRKNSDWISKVWLKDLNWKLSEDFLEKVINSDTYNWKNILRIYSSWNIFLDKKREKVYLVKTDKDWKVQYQFTWWSPKEEENKNVIFKENWAYKFDLEKMRINARIRAKNRLWVDILENYNDNPIVDWALLENKEDWEIFYRLVCLLHFVTKKFDWVLNPTWEENAVEWDWFEIKELQNLENIAPNVEIVVNEALKILGNNE